MLLINRILEREIVKTLVESSESLFLFYRQIASQCYAVKTLLELSEKVMATIVKINIDIAPVLQFFNAAVRATEEINETSIFVYKRSYDCK